MPPQRPWPSTTTFSTSSAATANSMAAEVPCWAASGWKVGTRLATLRSTNSSPGPASKMVSGAARLSQQAITSATGDWPSRARRLYLPSASA